ncbi:MAG TPA: response regulator [Blastocatellia bacterium]|nr:response regulator [Blastocatellia bacterium]
MTHRVLIVDDDPELRKSLRAALEINHFEVAEAEDVPSAMAALKADFFNVVLLDIHLPGVSGLDALRQIKELQPLCRVIMITAYPSPQSAIDALNRAAFGYLEKPIDMKKLMMKLSRALVQQREELFLQKPLRSRLVTN